MSVAKPEALRSVSPLFQFVIALVVWELALWFVHGEQSGDFSVTSEARRKMQNYNRCVEQIIESMGDTPATREIAHYTCAAISFLT